MEKNIIVLIRRQLVSESKNTKGEKRKYFLCKVMKLKGKTVCFNCMNLSDDMEVCTYCGSPISSIIPRQEMNQVLRQGHMLQNCYLVGKAFFSDGFIIRYHGLDVINECPVDIIELFPWDLSDRHDDGITVIHEKNPDGFEKVTTRFQRRIAAIKKTDLFAMEKIKACFVENGTTYVVSSGIPQDAPTLTHIMKSADQDTLRVIKEMALSLHQLHKMGLYCGLINTDDIHIIGGSALLPLTFPEFSRYSTKNLHTSPYIAPEVFEGIGIGPQSDVYSICALLYGILRKRPLPDAFERSKTSADALVKDLKKSKASKKLSLALQKGLTLDSDMRSDTLDEIIPLIDTIPVSMKVKKLQQSSSEIKDTEIKNTSNSNNILKRILFVIILIIVAMIIMLIITQSTLRKMKNISPSLEPTITSEVTLEPEKTLPPTPEPTETPEITNKPTDTPEPSNTSNEEEIDRVGDDTMPVDPLYEDNAPTTPPEEEYTPEPTKQPVKTKTPAKTIKPKKTVRPEKKAATKKPVSVTKKPQRYTSSKPTSKPQTQQKSKKPVVKVEPGDGTDLDWIK